MGAGVSATRRPTCASACNSAGRSPRSKSFATASPTCSSSSSSRAPRPRSPPRRSMPARDERARRVSMAKIQIVRSGRFVCENAVQLHGAIGIAAEHASAHALARITGIASTFGDLIFHRRRYLSLSPEGTTSVTAPDLTRDLPAVARIRSVTATSRSCTWRASPNATRSTTKRSAASRRFSVIFPTACARSCSAARGDHFSAGLDLALADRHDARSTRCAARSSGTARSS